MSTTDTRLMAAAAELDHVDVSGDAASRGECEQLAAVAAVVVHYRNATDTLACVASLAAQEPRPHIFVVDNASPDGSWPTIARELADAPHVTLHREAHNGGFGSGCNRGIDRALTALPSAQFVLLLNPDATLAPGALAELLGTAQRHPRAGLVGCRIDTPDGDTWFANGRLPLWTLSGFHCAAPAGEAEHPASFVTGCCMLLAADLLRGTAALRFDESFFLYCEDVDLCMAVAERGREIWITQRARAVHAGGGSQPGQAVLGELTAERLTALTSAKVRLANKRLSWLRHATFWLTALVARPLLGLWHSRSLRFVRPYVRGLRQGVTSHGLAGHVAKYD
ncbi:MAG: glycosyltransferase family 2 protein [Planctomycetota bacterium]